MIHPVLQAAAMIFALTSAMAVHAQSTQVVEDKDVGMRMAIPKNWQWRSRQRDVFVNCDPTREDRGRMACYFYVQSRKAPVDQKAIADADRAKWKGWVEAGGMRKIISARDTKLAGLPAYEVVEGERNAPTSRRVFVLVPGKGQVFDVTYATMFESRDYDRYSAPVAAALETLVPTN
jgi:hypothetical protein